MFTSGQRLAPLYELHPREDIFRYRMSAGAPHKEKEPPSGKPPGFRSVFEIGSTTKRFTGVLLADIVADGEVSLDDPIGRYLPDEVTPP